MITPAVLISASGTLTLSTSNRLGRIVDRGPDTAQRSQPASPWDATDVDALEKRAMIADQIARQAQRIGILQAALITLYTAIGLLIASSLSIGLSAVAKGWFAWVPVMFGLLGALALFLGAVLLIREARFAVRSTLRAGVHQTHGRPADRRLRFRLQRQSRSLPVPKRRILQFDLPLDTCLNQMLLSPIGCVIDPLMAIIDCRYGSASIECD